MSWAARPARAHSPEAAGAAYDEAARRQHGEFYRAWAREGGEELVRDRR